MPGKPVRILIIDDARKLIELIRQVLENEACEIETADNCQAGLQLFEHFAPQILLCDIILPDGNGMDICRFAKQSNPYCQVLLLSSLTDELDKVLGLELGADDYITKPFSVRELRSRVRAAIRRLELFENQAVQPVDRQLETPAAHSRIEIEGLLIEPESRRVWKNHLELDLTRKEFELLVLLASHRGRVFSRQDLLERLWQHNPEINERSIDAQVRRLRDKIEPAESPLYIETVRGSGYRFLPATSGAN